ncbi:hypothetical protein GCM10009792_13140 [Microcella alkalica]
MPERGADAASCGAQHEAVEPGHREHCEAVRHEVQASRADGEVAVPAAGRAPLAY